MAAATRFGSATARGLDGNPRAVTHYPPQLGGRPVGLGRQQAFPMPSTGTYYNTMQAMLGSSMGSGAVHSVGSGDVGSNVPATAMFVATNRDQTLERLREGDLMFACEPRTEHTRGEAYNLPAVNALLREAAWDLLGRPGATVAPQRAGVPMQVPVGKRSATVAGLFGQEDLVQKERRELYATTIDEAVRKYLPLGPLLGTMRDAHSDNTAFSYVIIGKAKIPRLLVDVQVGDRIGLVYTETDMPNELMYDVLGTPIKDRKPPARAVQVRMVNFTAQTLAANTNEAYAYDPVLGTVREELSARQIMVDGKVVSYPRKVRTHSHFLGVVKELPTQAPTPEHVALAHVDAAAYNELWREAGMVIDVLRRPRVVGDAGVALAHHNAVINPPLFQ